jgi:hypothetical protein
VVGAWMVVVVGGLTGWLADLAWVVDGGAGSFAGAEAWMKEGWEGRLGTDVDFGVVRRKMGEEDSCCVDRKRRGELFLASFNLFRLFVFWRVVSAILLPLSEGIPSLNLWISLSFLSRRTFFLSRRMRCSLRWTVPHSLRVFIGRMHNLPVDFNITGISIFAHENMSPRLSPRIRRGGA